MSYSISKTNYIINASSFGNNRTQRTSIDFGIYEPSTESAGTEPSFPTRVLEGPQVTFGDTTTTNLSDRITTPSETNILQSTGLPQPNDTFVEDMVNTLNNLSSARRRTNRASGFASTALGRNRN